MTISSAPLLVEAKIQLRQEQPTLEDMDQLNSSSHSHLLVERSHSSNLDGVEANLTMILSLSWWMVATGLYLQDSVNPPSLKLSSLSLDNSDNLLSEASLHKLPKDSNLEAWT